MSRRILPAAFAALLLVPLAILPASGEEGPSVCVDAYVEVGPAGVLVDEDTCLPEDLPALPEPPSEPPSEPPALPGLPPIGVPELPPAPTLPPVEVPSLP